MEESLNDAGRTQSESGVIAKFDVINETGELRADSGEMLRFGRSACVGFEPLVETRVQIQKSEPHPLGGFRATRLTLDPTDHGYDARIAERDVAFRSEDPSAESVAVALNLSSIVLLLGEAPPLSGSQAIRVFFRSSGSRRKVI